MDLEGLSTFVLLAEHGSGSQVARLQGLSQAAVSQRISRVESAYGVRLFVRLGEGMTLTEEGRLLLPDAQRILQRLVDLGASVTRADRDEQGVTRILVDQSIRGERLVKRLQGISTVDLVRVLPQTSWATSLEVGESDLVFQSTCGPLSEIPGLQRIELKFQSGISFAWNPESLPIAEAAGIEVLLRETLIVPSEELIPGFGKLVELLGAKSLISGNLVTVEVHSELDAREACTHGIGVLFFPGDAIARLGLDSTQLASRRAMEFSMPKSYRVNLFAREDEARPHVLEVIRQFVRPGTKKDAVNGSPDIFRD